MQTVFDQSIDHAESQKDIVKYVALLEKGKYLDGPGYRNEYVARGLDMLRMKRRLETAKQLLRLQCKEENARDVTIGDREFRDIKTILLPIISHKEYLLPDV